MKASLGACFLLWLGIVLPAWAGGPGLTDERLIFPAGTDYGGGAMRLSPDGRGLLYVRREENTAPRPANPQERWSSHLYRLVLRELVGGQEKVLPIPAFDWDDPLAMMLARNIFSADGRVIVLGAGIDANDDGIFSRDRERMRAVLYDVPSGKCTSLPVEEEIVLPTFARDGKGLIIMTWRKREGAGAIYLLPDEKAQPRELAGRGLMMNPCPAADVLPIYVLPGGAAKTRPSARQFILFDLAGDKPIANLPIHERNTHLDDYTPQWTADGRYLFYVDLPATPAGTQPAHTLITRVWDRLGGKELAVVEQGVPVGPGPTPTSMVLAADRRAMFLHDAATGSTWPLGAGLMDVFSAGGGKVLYARHVEGKRTAYVADISPPPADK